MNEDQMSTRQYWDDLAAARGADKEAAQKFAQSREGQFAELHKTTRIDLAESWEPEQDAARKEAAMAEIAEIEAEKQAEENAIWTREETIARRKAWNAAVQSPKYQTRRGVVLVSKVVWDLGYDAAALKRHIARHGL